MGRKNVLCVALFFYRGLYASKSEMESELHILTIHNNICSENIRMAKRVSTVCQYALLNFGIHWTVPSFLLYSVFTRLVFHFTLCAFPPSLCTLYRNVPVRAGNPSSLKCTRTVFFFDASFFQVII